MAANAHQAGAAFPEPAAESPANRRGWRHAGHSASSAPGVATTSPLVCGGAWCNASSNHQQAGWGQAAQPRGPGWLRPRQPCMTSQRGAESGSASAQGQVSARDRRVAAGRKARPSAGARDPRRVPGTPERTPTRAGAAATRTPRLAGPTRGRGRRSRRCSAHRGASEPTDVSPGRVGPGRRPRGSVGGFELRAAGVGTGAPRDLERGVADGGGVAAQTSGCTGDGRARPAREGPRRGQNARRARHGGRFLVRPRAGAHRLRQRPSI